MQAVGFLLCAKNAAPIIVANQHKVKLNFLNAVIKLSIHRMIFNQTSATSSQMCVDLTSRSEYSDISTKEGKLLPNRKRFFIMRTISIQKDIENVLLQYARAIPEVFTSYDIANVEIQHNPEDTNLWDIIFVESDETEVVLGEIALSLDFFVTFDIFED